MRIPPEWINKSNYKINEILEDVGPYVSLKAPIPIEKIIESYVGDVDIIRKLDYNFPEGVSAFATKDMQNGWLIVVNGRETVERQRFSIAHELGHIVLLLNQAKKVYCSRDNKGWDEQLCDRFAGDILMPESMVREIYRLSPIPYLEDIAGYFKVSRPVAEIQLKRLGLGFASKFAAF
jgi:Zn-dependent peptidase ImmA (M78 family)